MRFCLNEFLYSFAYALDCVEHRLYDTRMGHTLRVAYMAGLMAQYDQELNNYLQEAMFCAILHDNALSEFERMNYNNISLHVEEGEKNFQGNFLVEPLKGSILYHHENADGSGSYGMLENNTPFLAQCIHLAHDIDTQFILDKITKDDYEQIKLYIEKNVGKLYSKKCQEAFESILTFQKMRLMRFPMDEIMKIYFEDKYIYKSADVYALCRLIANIIDTQSHFTRNHSIGVASKVIRMAKHYGMDESLYDELFFAGAIHDIGKLVIDKDIIEKNGRLTENEFDYIQNHAYYTYKILHHVRGLEKVCKWASLHHEKLDGSGYPFHLIADDLDFIERLIACIDIYQALTEDRPYKDPYSHQKAMNIMEEDAKKGKIDTSIVKAIDLEFREERK